MGESRLHSKLYPCRNRPEIQFEFIFSGTLIYQPVGCYLDNGFSPHPMPLLLKDFRPDMNWNDIAAVIERCAALAHDKRFR